MFLLKTANTILIAVLMKSHRTRVYNYYSLLFIVSQKLEQAIVKRNNGVFLNPFLMMQHLENIDSSDSSDYQENIEYPQSPVFVDYLDSSDKTDTDES